MTRSELIDILAARFPVLSTADIVQVVKLIQGELCEALEHGERIEIRGFGSFSTTIRPPRVGRNPKTGVTVEVQAKHAVHFKPGLELRERVDAASNGKAVVLSASKSTRAPSTLAR
jgi:integration host factor subunit beta